MLVIMDWTVDSNQTFPKKQYMPSFIWLSSLSSIPWERFITFSVGNLNINIILKDYFCLSAQKTKQSQYSNNGFIITPNYSGLLRRQNSINNERIEQCNLCVQWTVANCFANQSYGLYVSSVFIHLFIDKNRKRFLNIQIRLKQVLLFYI